MYQILNRQEQTLHLILGKRLRSDIPCFVFEPDTYIIHNENEILNYVTKKFTKGTENGGAI